MRKLAWFAGGFGAACLLSCFVAEHLLFAVIGAVLCMISAAVFVLTRPHKTEAPYIHLLSAGRRVFFSAARRFSAFFLGCTLAFLWFVGYTALFRTSADNLADTEQVISGTVTSYPQETSIGGYSVILRIDGNFRSPDVLIYGNAEWGALVPGDRISCTARLKSSEFLYGDETTYYTARGLFLIGYCNDTPAAERATSVPLRYWPTFCAHALKEGIYTAFNGSSAPLAAAVTLGDKSGLSEQTYSALNRSGIMHAAVVSGMHISFLSALLLILCGGRQKAALALIPVLFFYALMAGGTPSAFRAVIMQTALLVGPILNRENDSPSSLGLALLILLIQNPYAAASVSLQLSFASVAGIMLISSRMATAMLTPVRLRLRDEGRFWRFILTLYRLVTASIAVSLGAMLFTVPLITLYFGRIPLVSPVTNILTLWAVTALMVCALAVGTLGIFFPAVAGILGTAVGLFARYIQFVTEFIGRRPLAAADGSNPYFLFWLLTVYLLLGTVLLARRKGRHIFGCFGISAILLVLAVMLNRFTVDRTDLTVTALDVGQGASTLIQSDRCAVLVDCGGNASSSAGDLAADRLSVCGRTKLDALILTHLDDDHFNGVPQLFWRLEIKQVFLCASGTDPNNLAELLRLAEAESAEVTFVTDMQTISVGRASVTLYPPLGRGTSNEEGLFVLCSQREFDMLITGDADSFVEKMLLKYYEIPDLELLMVGHHGSKNSTCTELLNELRPELAVISVGYNSYGHPAEETLERLSAAGAQALRTDTSGSVAVYLRNGMISLR